MPWKHYLFSWLNAEATPWAPWKHTTAQKGALCITAFATVSFNRLFMWPRLVPHFNNRPRGNTGSYVVDTGVSLSTHASPINSNPLGQLISCRGRKWEGGQGTERAGVMMMSQQEKKGRIVGGEARQMSKQASGRAKRAIHVYSGPNLWLLLILLWEVLPVMRI